MKWYKDGIATPDVVSSAVKEYRSEMDLVQKWINDNCEVDILYSESATVLFKNICDYIETNKEFKMSNTMFGRNMGKKFEKRRIGNTTMYMGIRLRKKSFAEQYEEAHAHE